MRTTPWDSSQRNGAVERFHQSVQALSRTLVAQVSGDYGVTIKDDSVGAKVVLVFVVDMLVSFLALLLIINQFALLPWESAFYEYCVYYLPLFFGYAGDAGPAAT